jgi:hypothetical protein
MPTLNDAAKITPGSLVRLHKDQIIWLYFTDELKSYSQSISVNGVSKQRSLCLVGEVGKPECITIIGSHKWKEAWYVYYHELKTFYWIVMTYVKYDVLEQ